MYSHTLFWIWFACLVVLIAGLVARRKSLHDAGSLGAVFFAAPLAAFGAEHLTNLRGMAQGVPVWMPGRMFWASFVGVALICAGLAIALKILDRLAATLTGIMFVLFVAMIHLPNAIASHDRIIWTIPFREMAFASGGFAIARRWKLFVRIFMGAALIFFAIQHFLHPMNAPGVPLAKMTPHWVPARGLWGYFTGLLELVAGIATLRPGWYSRKVVTLAGMWVAVLVFVLYLPIFLMSPNVEGINYVADTMLFAGAVLAAGASLKR